MKSKSKFIKKLVSLSLVGTFLAAAIPTNIAFANLQKHVTNVTIASIPTNDNNYKINFNWTLPTSWSTVADGAALNGDAIHTPDGFLIQGINATANETKATDYADVAGSDILTATIAPIDPLNSGSIYEFDVKPYHYHSYERDEVTVEEKAPYEDSKLEKVLFMTDINVEASGAGNTLTVTWDNPLYKGKDVFSGYRIYYQRGGDKVLNFNTYKDVSMDDEAILKQTDKTRDGVQLLTYDIFDANLIQGEYYAVKVEPLINGAPARDLSATGQSYRNVVINNVSYKLAFRYMADKEYRTNEANIDIPLEVYEDGKDFLKLHWWGISNTIGTIDRIEIYDGDSDTDIGNKIGTIYSSQALYVNTWQIDKPDAKKYYQLKIFVDGRTNPVKSAVAFFDPSIVNITPNKPDIYAEVNSTQSTVNPSLDVYWDAFVRYPYNENEEAFVQEDGTYIDTNVVYDMWITDSIETINDVNLNIKALSRIPASSLQLTKNDNLDLPCFSTNLTQYVSLNESGGYELKQITTNKTYYIKLVAIKPATNANDKAAEPVQISIYVPTKENISTPQSLNKPPLRIKKDTDGKKVIDQSSITVEWNSRWYEVYDEETDSWYSLVSKRDGNLIFGIENIDEDKDTLIPLYSAEDETEARELFKAAGFSEAEAAALQIRLIDLSTEDISYELKYLPFDEINTSGGYLTYLEKLLNSDSQDWNQIKPTINSNNYLEHKIDSLEKNTSYVVMLRPYRTLSDGTKVAYPTYVIGTTLPDDTILEITPTVPVLEEVEHDDVSFQVKWPEHIPSLDYELAVNEVVVEDPSKAAILVDSETIQKDGIEKSENARLYMYYTVKNLFPKTGYYVWIRSIAHNESGDVYSQWSNPIFIETDPLSPPDAPTGLGLASQESLKIYNSANSTEYIASDYTYIIVEWLKDYNDKEYVSVTNKSGEGFEVLDHSDFNNSFMVMFKDLLPNTLYYFRVKTRLTVSKGDAGESVKSYAYVIQMADNKNFEEPVEIIVPEDKSDKNSSANKYYVVDSEWGPIVGLYTEPSDGEYDADKDPEFYPLPDEDFEIIYDYPTRSLTYRFRSDKEDEEGLDDNLVDQRFISRLVANKVYNFPIDLTSYMDGEIKQRIVEIPYTVMTAFDERNISLEVTAKNATFKFKPGFLDTPQVNNLYKYGQGANVKIIITERPADSPVLGFKQGYLSAPQNVGITIYTDTNVTVLDAAGENIDVSMKLDNRYSTVDSNVGLYFDNKTTDVWNRLNYVYDNATGTYKTETARLATFSVIANAAPLAAGSINSQANSNIGNVTSRLNITDLSSFNPQKALSVVQFNNIVAAVANGKKDVALNDALSTADHTALSRKGLLLVGSVVSREQAVNALVKLYETKTGRQMTYYTPLASSPYANEIKAANPSYQTALLKAADLGFFETSNGVRPKDIMSLNELFYMTNIILADSNY